jgi:ABC-2 type transport system ATP-binding protein
MTENAITVRNLVKKFKSRYALNGLNLDVPKGSVFGLIGQNGAGKTTTFSILAGLLKADSGDVDILGLGPFNPAEHKGILTVLPQDSQLPGHMKVIDMLYYLALLQGLPAIEARRSAYQTLEWVNLADRAGSKVKTLSHGMLRRVNIAQAFLGDPQIVLLDEPTSGLDPSQVVQIREVIRNRTGAQTIVISSHILSEIEAACDHVAFIEHGVTLRQDALEDVIRRNSLIIYRVENCDFSTKFLQEAFPEGEYFCDAQKKELVVKFPENGFSTASVNARILQVLIDQNIGIIEVRAGSNLENEYLKHL